MPRAAGRKTLKQEALQGDLEIQPGHCIAKVVSLRGSNIIEVEDDKSNKSLCLLPAKFNKMLWIKKGSFVLVQGERDKAIESGSKVTGIISHVLFEDQIRSLKRRSLWPDTFNETTVHPPSSKKEMFSDMAEDDHGLSEDSCTDDEGLPPLEANQNRRGVSYHIEESSSEEE